VVAAWLIGAGLSAIRTAAAWNAHVLDYLAVEVVLRLDHMAHVDPAVVAGVGRIMILSRWVRGCARLCGGHEAIPSWSVPWGVSPPPGLPTLTDPILPCIILRVNY
jgi:hypothetical protein